MSLETWLQEPEGKVLEHKAELLAQEPVLRTAVAFANTAGGVILFGVEDGTRRVLGISDPLALEARLCNLITDCIRPQVIPDIDILPWRKTQVLALKIHPSNARPHYLKALGPDQGVFVRVGSSNRKADQLIINELRHVVSSTSYDEQAIANGKPAEIDIELARKLFGPQRKLRDQDLQTMQLIVKHQGKLRPSVGGILLFGNTKKNHFPDAWIQAGRFRGSNRTDIIDTMDIDAPLPLAVDVAIAFVNKHETQGIKITAARNTKHWSLPPIAVREAIINALVHADYAQRGSPIRIAIYDDRLEIENPGMLPFGLTLPDIRQGMSKLRNRVIGRIFRELGLIEQWGSGIRRMTDACLEAGLPEPLLEELGSQFRVTLFKQRGTARVSADDRDKAIMDLLKKNAGLSTQELAGQLGLSARAMRTRLIKLVAKGLVVSIGSHVKDPNGKYYLAKNGA